MPLKEIIDKYGRKFTWHECNGHAMLDKVVDLLLPQGLEARLEEIKNLEIRDDDIMVCTFPKAGLLLFLSSFLSILSDCLSFILPVCLSSIQ